MSTLRTSTSKAHGPISRRQPFRTSGALRGYWRNYTITAGMLPPEFRALLGADFDAESAPEGIYVVQSYNTPIAWYVPYLGVWRRPAVKYSVTTSKHQGQCPTDGTPA